MSYGIGVVLSELIEALAADAKRRRAAELAGPNQTGSALSESRQRDDDAIEGIPTQLNFASDALGYQAGDKVAAWWYPAQRAYILNAPVYQSVAPVLIPEAALVGVATSSGVATRRRSAKAGRVEERIDDL